MKGEVNLGVAQRSLPMDPSTIYGQGIMQSKPGLGTPGKDTLYNAIKQICGGKGFWFSTQ